MKAAGDNAPVSNLRSHRKCIEKIKTEIENLNFDINLTPDGLPNDDLSNLYYRLKSLILFCIDESEDIETIHNNFEELRKERDGYKLQSKRLNEENKWLRDELKTTQDKLQQKELSLVEFEESNKSLNFLIELQNNTSIENGANKKSDSLLNGGKFLNSSLIPIPISSVSPIGGGSSHSSTPTSQIQHQTMNNNNQIMTTTPMSSSTMTTSISSLPQNHQLHNIQNQLPNHEVPPRLKTLHQLVIQYASQGRYEIAIPLCKQTLHDLEQSSGHYHPDVATMLNILSLVYRDKGDFEEAAESLTEALEIRKRTLGKDSPKVAATLNNLSVLYAKQGNHAKAEPMCRDALKIREEILGVQHPDVAKQLNNLALLCQNQGKFQEVEKYYKRALAIYMDAFSAHDPNVIKTKNNLANCYLKQSKLKDAESLLKEVLKDAMDKQWSGIERDAKSKPIWVIAEERERTKKLSMSVDTLNVRDEENGTGDMGTSNTNTSDSSNPPPFGFEIKSKGKEDKIALLTTLKLLSSVYRRDNKQIASDTLEEWLNWAGKSLSKYQMDIRWLSYESSLVQNDLYESGDYSGGGTTSNLTRSHLYGGSRTLWYPTSSTSNNNNNTNNNLFRRPYSTMNLSSPSTSTSFSMMDTRNTTGNVRTRIPINYNLTPQQSQHYHPPPINNNENTQNNNNTSNTHSRYLNSSNNTQQQTSQSKFESEKSNIYDNFDKS